MKGICLRYAANEAEAEDILQEVFMVVFKKLDQYDGKGALGGWLRRVTVNKALEQYRKNATVGRLKDRYSSMMKKPVDDSLLEQLNLADLLAKIQQLPTGYRTIFNLYAVEGFNHREIGEKLNISAGTSKSQYSRARSMLMEMILKEQEEELKRLAYAKR
jgi:RNA polymerase sigma-70 factor (ECF subfamily)